ncbi:hypothetical protein J6590_026417 [Homalodisca vitripennis]|nr:hypothetical protein J6590_026417 [Homalodisca vitripennis]
MKTIRYYQRVRYSSRTLSLHSNSSFRCCLKSVVTTAFTKQALWQPIRERTYTQSGTRGFRRDHVCFHPSSARRDRNNREQRPGCRSNAVGQHRHTCDWS